MRYFPSAARTRALVTTAVGVLALSALAAPSVVPSSLFLAAAPVASGPDADDLRDKQRDVQQEIKQAQQEAEEASHKVAASTAAFHTAQAELADARSYAIAVRAKLHAAQAEDARMAAALEVAQAKLDKARADVVAGKAALEAQREVVKDSVVAAYQMGDPRFQALEGFLNSSSLTDLTRRLEYTDTVVEDESTAFDELHAAEVLLVIREGEVEAAERDVAAQRRGAAQHLKQTESLVEQATSAKLAVIDMVDRRRVARHAAYKARQHDLAVLAKLKKQEQKIKEQILAAAAKDKGPGYVGSANGFLLAPVAGSVTSPFGYRTHPIYGYWGLHDGTDFGAGCGAPMRAAAAGTVISAYYSSVYGNRLYLNVGKVNGHNVTVVYNHATSYRYGVGARVARGATVGYVGSTGWSTGCHLHFTVLRDGNPVDPMGYL